MSIVLALSRNFGSFRLHTIRTFAILFTVLVVLSLLGVQGWSLQQARNDQIENARIQTANMTRALAQQTDDTIRAAEVALVGVVQSLETEGTDATVLARVQALLRLTVAKLPALDSVSFYNSSGHGIITSRTHILGSFSIPDRDYFKHHAGNSDREAHIGSPVRSRTSGRWIMPVSRRVNHPDGSFAGVAVATIDLGYLQEFHNSFDLGRDGTIFLLSSKGKIIVRRPFSEAHINADASKGPVFQTYLKKGKAGSAVLTAHIDGIERMYSYQHLAHYPLIAASAVATIDVLADWHQETVRILAVEAVLLALLCLLGYRLVRLIGEREQGQRELRKAKTSLERANQALERLTLQDSLTGLGNRRLFDAAFMEEFDRAKRATSFLALIMIDVDYFKRYNDLYGHPTGDACLQQLGETLLEAGCRPGDVAVRYGGEEMAVLLPDTDRDGAVAMGERFRHAVLARAIPHGGNPETVVTVSIGAAACLPGQDESSCKSLLQSADQALYAAKERGRNQVCIATDMVRP